MPSEAIARALIAKEMLEKSARNRSLITNSFKGVPTKPISKLNLVKGQ